MRKSREYGASISAKILHLKYEGNGIIRETVMYVKNKWGEIYK